LAIVLFLGLISILAAGCGSSTDLASSWTDNPVAVEDSVERWYGALKPLEDTHVSLGVQNDTGYVYLCVVAPQEQFRRQMMGPGLTIWFESDQGQKMGIHYPMGFASRQSGTEYGENSSEPRARDQMERLSLGEVEIIGPGKHDRNILSPVELRGIQVKIGNVGTQTVYEMRVPLRESAAYPYAVGASPGSKLTLEIETGKFEPHKREYASGGEEGEGMHGYGGRGGHGGGYPGGEEGMYGGERRGGGSNRGGNRPESLDETVKVQLASMGNSTHH
jgi:hypothetical protein